MKITLKEYAEKHGLREDTVRHAILRGKIKAEKPHGRIYIDSDTVWSTEMNKSNICTHGLSNHPLHNTWCGMKQRCYNPKHTAYAVYGGRGITVCDEWRDDLKAFVDWAESHGYKKGLTIDRINNDLGYSPDNCMFITRSENAHKRAIDNRKKEEEKIKEHVKELQKEQWFVFKEILTKEKKRVRESENKRFEKLIPYLKNGFTYSLLDDLSMFIAHSKYVLPRYMIKINAPSEEYIADYVENILVLV